MLSYQEENSEATMIFIQLPPTLPLTKQTGNISGNETNSRSKPAASVGSAKKTCGIEELPAGFMGKMLVYRSGAVKLKLGDTLYDVSKFFIIFAVNDDLSDLLYVSDYIMN